MFKTILITIFISSLAGTQTYALDKEALVTKKEEAKRKQIFSKSKEHQKNRDYYTALDIIAQMYRYTTPDQNVQHHIEELVSETGTHYFNTFNDLELRKMNILVRHFARPDRIEGYLRITVGSEASINQLLDKLQIIFARQ